MFNAGFSDYTVTLQLDQAAFCDHVTSNGIDLAWSRVAVDGHPVALVLIAHRGADAWVGGMGTAPSHRRRGLGQRLMVAGLETAQAHGCQTAWLEVIEGNDRAIGLYEKLGFATERSLVVWSLAAGTPPPPADVWQAVEVPAAQAWIAAHRADREPWQRTDTSLERMAEHGAELEAAAVIRAGETAAAIVYRSRPDAVTVLQVAADDQPAALTAVAAAAAGRPLRLSNLPAGGSLEPVLTRLGAEPVIRQREMRLALSPSAFRS